MDHAYGGAEDVPALLSGLMSKDPAQREIAWDDGPPGQAVA